MANIARSIGAHRGWETRRERDEFATQNIPDALIPLWEKTKLNFQGSPEKRAEKFVHYAHEHEDESMEAVIDESDRKLEAMIRARERSGGFASLEAILVGLGLAAAGYFVWRALRKKPPQSPPHVGMMPWQQSGGSWGSYVPPPPYPWPPQSSDYDEEWEQFEQQHFGYSPFMPPHYPMTSWSSLVDRG